MLRRFLSNDLLFWRVFAVLLALFAYLKGFRLPSLYAATEVQLNYEHGFIKRGLFGAVFDALNVPIHQYVVFASVALVIFAAFVLAFILFIRSARLFRDAFGVLVCAVFLSSYAVTYMAHLVGRMDIILFAITLGILSIQNPWARSAALLVLGPLATLLHEMFVLTMFAVCLLPSVLDLLRQTSWRRALLHIALIGAPVLATAVAVFGVALQPDVTPELARAIRRGILSRIDFPPDAAPWNIISRSAAENLALMAEVNAAPGAPMRWFVNLGIFAPAVAFLLVACSELLKRLEHPRPRLALAAICGATLLPLVMNALGTDMYRWSVFAVFNAFVAAALLYRMAVVQPQHTELDGGWRNAALLVIAINLLSGGALQERVTDTPYPYSSVVSSAARTLEEGKIIQPQVRHGAPNRGQRERPNRQRPNRERRQAE